MDRLLVSVLLISLLPGCSDDSSQGTSSSSASSSSASSSSSSSGSGGEGGAGGAGSASSSSSSGSGGVGGMGGAGGGPTGLTVDFNNGTFDPLVLFYGPNDNPAQANPAYTVDMLGGAAVYVAPQAAAGPRLTGFLELPATLTPIASDMSFSWVFPAANELASLAPTGAGIAIAGCYLRGAYDFQAGKGDWAGGMFGDYWFGFFKSAQGSLSVIRQGTTNLVSEPFTASTRAEYRIEKQGLVLRLLARYDAEPSFHSVGQTTITVNSGGSDSVAVTHVRVLDTSGAAIKVTADDFVWTF